MNEKLGDLFGKSKERITLIGVELEGGWTSVPPGTTITHDGSVRGLIGPPRPTTATTPVTAAAQEALIEAQINQLFASHTRGRSLSQRQQDTLRLDIRTNVLATADLTGNAGRLPVQTGEIPSPVMPPSEMPTWMRRFYPQVVNETCGLHVHMSFGNALHYQRLMVPAYQDAILTWITRFAEEEKLPTSHPLWERLKGNSRYCQHRFWPDLQVRQRAKDHDQQREGHRYTTINFCYGTNGTVECRLLPMMNEVEQGIRAVQRVLDITNAFLGNGKTKERRHARIEVKGDLGVSEVRRVNLEPTQRQAEYR